MKPPLRGPLAVGSLESIASVDSIGDVVSSNSVPE
jgi:hypothetical protein